MKARFERSGSMMETLPEDLPEVVEYDIPDGTGIQLTYRELRLTPSGETLAILKTDQEGDGWWIKPSPEAVDLIPQLANASTFPFSDIIID
jgi:hypothetical protein